MTHGLVCGSHGISRPMKRATVRAAERLTRNENLAYLSGSLPDRIALRFASAQTDVCGSDRL